MLENSKLNSVILDLNNEISYLKIKLPNDEDNSGTMKLLLNEIRLDA